MFIDPISLTIQLKDLYEGYPNVCLGLGAALLAVLVLAAAADIKNRLVK